MSGRGRRGRGSALGRARGAFRLLGVLALACALAGAAGEPRAQGTGTGTAPAQVAGTRAQAKVSVRGVVVDQKLQVPLPGVSVTLVEAGLTVTTDEEGRYAFDGVAAGAYTLLAERDGYAPISLRLSPAALAAEARGALPSQSVVSGC